MTKFIEDFGNAQELIEVYWEKVREVEAVLREKKDSARTLFIMNCANNIDGINRLLKQIETRNQEEEEILEDILQLCIKGFEGRTLYEDIQTWLNFIPWTLEGYLENYGLLRKPQKIEIPVETKWVIVRHTWSTLVGVEQCAQESAIAQVA